jgi:hypothetical protein
LLVCDLDHNPTSTHFLTTPLGKKKKKINQEAHMADFIAYISTLVSLFLAVALYI